MADINDVKMLSTLIKRGIQPFEVKLLVLKPDHVKMLRQVSDLAIFAPSSRQYSPNGLFSIETFGAIGSEQRASRFGYIDLKVPIFHPLIHQALIKVKTLYGGIIAGTDYAIWDTKELDFVKATPIDGRTGYSFFLEHFDELHTPEKESIGRKIFKDLIDKYKDNCLLDKLLVMPAGLRDVEIKEDGRPSEDDINVLYRKVIITANLMPVALLKTSPASLDTARYRLQLAVNEVFYYILDLLEGKRKLILEKWAGRRIFFGARNVISSMINETPILGSPLTVGYNETAVGLYQYLKGTLPISSSLIRTQYLSKVFPGPNNPMVLVNKKTLRSEYINIDSDVFDKWNTDDGLEHITSDFGIEELRHKPISITDTHYLGLLYQDDKYFMFLQDPSELPPHLDKKLIKPITYTEFFYINVFERAKNTPIIPTRYPVAAMGGVYPSMTFLKTTVKSKILEELDEHGQPTGKVAYQFPIAGEAFFNTQSVHSSKLARLGADFLND